MGIVSFGGGVTGIRGSVAGVTFGNSRSGPTIRRRQKPVFPRTDVQGFRNSTLAVVAQYWRDQLAAGDRTNWETLAAATNFTNSLGQTYQISGIALFIRSMTVMQISDQAITNVAPMVATEAAPDLTIDSVAAGVVRVATWPNYVLLPAGRLNYFVSAPTSIAQAHDPTSFTFQLSHTLSSFAVLPRPLVLTPPPASGTHIYLRFKILRLFPFPIPPPNGGRGVVSFELIRDVVVA